jgi:hypothetical protein
MDNYYKRPSPQELRYRDVLRAVSDLGPTAAELAAELDHAVRQLVSRAVDAAVVQGDQRAGELLLDRLSTLQARETGARHNGSGENGRSESLKAH